MTDRGPEELRGGVTLERTAVDRSVERRMEWVGGGGRRIKINE